MEGKIKEIAFILSLEHQTLPEAELKSVLAAENIPFTIKKKFRGLLILEIPEKSVLEFEAFKSSLSRLSLTHEIFQVHITAPETNLLSKIRQYPWKEIIVDEYAVRVKNRGESVVNTLELEREIGGIIKDKIGNK